MSGSSRSGIEMADRAPPSRTVTLGRVQPQAPCYRTIYCNDRESNLMVHFKGNSISTTKYNILTFLPKGLFEQFRRVANLYFLMVSILSSTPLSPISPITNVLPLSVVLFVSLVKEAWEDWKRLQNDKAINNSSVEVLEDQKWESVPWKSLQVGDLVRVKTDGYFPADLLFLASTNADGVCYVETANLDGETNLKIRKALEKTWDYVTIEKASEFKGFSFLSLISFSRTNEVQQLNAQLALLQRMYKDARAELSVLKAENKELKRKATVMFRFGGPPYAVVEEQGGGNLLGGLGSTEATPSRAAQDGGKKKRPAAE
ncbi:hypothetical protein TEA_022873 [Camellia sinensis var. sinensis]|uniref:Uncharacterized protein n=1 Tax=Camellia sinensis var. sinensis TaxID=542762 RepID=A0A4S4DUJ1_CAMSN|nr:hypothetical protein TEA_022873 [Camellia sinensis var. sinensis]